MNNPEHKKQIITECKLNFYECAIHFFNTNDLLQILEVIDNLKATDANETLKINQASEGLKNLWFKHHLHKQDLNDLITKNK